MDYGLHHNPKCDKALTELVRLLSVYGIPFELKAFCVLEEARIQVCYPSADDMMIDAVSHTTSYGGNRGLIEILGADEDGDDYLDCVGFLTPQKAFSIFQKYHAKHGMSA